MDEKEYKISRLISWLVFLFLFSAIVGIEGCHVSNNLTVERLVEHGASPLVAGCAAGTGPCTIETYSRNDGRVQ